MSPSLRDALSPSMTKITVKGEIGSCQSLRKPGPETQESNPMPRFALRPLALAGILALVAVVIGAGAHAHGHR